MLAALLYSSDSPRMNRTSTMATIKRMKWNQPKPEWIGFLPDNDPFHQQVHTCLQNVGFASVRVKINKDLSMATFWLKKGAHSSFSTQTQAHAALFRLFRAEGVAVKKDDLVVEVEESGDWRGAFTPPQHRVPRR